MIPAIIASCALISALGVASMCHSIDLAKARGVSVGSFWASKELLSATEYRFNRRGLAACVGSLVVLASIFIYFDVAA